MICKTQGTWCQPLVHCQRGRWVRTFQRGASFPCSLVRWSEAIVGLRMMLTMIVGILWKWVGYVVKSPMIGKFCFSESCPRWHGAKHWRVRRLMELGGWMDGSSSFWMQSCYYTIVKTALQYVDDAAMTSCKGFTTVDTYQRFMANKLHFLIQNTSNLATQACV